MTTTTAERDPTARADSYSHNGADVAPLTADYVREGLRSAEEDAVYFVHLNCFLTDELSKIEDAVAVPGTEVLDQWQTGDTTAAKFAVLQIHRASERLRQIGELILSASERLSSAGPDVLCPWADPIPDEVTISQDAAVLQARIADLLRSHPSAWKHLNRKLTVLETVIAEEKASAAPPSHLTREGAG